MKQKLLNSLRLRVCALVALLLCATGSAWADSYKLVKDASELDEGDVILITSGTDGNVKALGPQSGNNCPEKAVSISSETISDKGDAQEITLETKDTNGNFTFKVATSTYLYAAAAKNNYLKTQASGAYWKILIDGSSYAATITDQSHTSNRNLLRYNSSSKLFSCYSSGQADVYIFKKVVATPCATPTFSPAAGTYGSTQSVTISTETEGATIYYTTDGTDPTSSSTPYISAISVSESMTIKAIAVKDGNSDSEVAIATYTITSAVATTTTINATGITNTDVYVSTAAGSFAATVKDNVDATISGASVTWSSSNTDVATIDPSTGVVTLVAKGVTTITADYAGVADTYQPSSDTYELTVTSSQPVTEETFTFSTMGYDNGANVTSVDGEACTLTFAQGTNGTNAPKYYNTGTGTRMYSGNTLTIASATKTIESIVFTFDGNNATLALAGGQPGTLTDASESKRTWTGSASSIQFTTTETNRIQVIKVTYDSRATSDLTKTGDVTLDFKGGDTDADLTEYFTTSSTGAITYTVADNTIIENVDELISALKVGSTTVTVSQTKDETYKAGEITINVTVNDTRTACVTDLDLTSDKTISLGDTGDLTATSTMDGDFTGTINYTYESADPTIFYIDGSEYMGAGVGGTTVTVWATPTGGNAANYSAVSKVVNVQVNGTNSITLDKSSYSAAYGSQAAFDISVTTPVSYDGTITAESSNSNVATVSVDGTTVTVTPKAVVGTATISITAGTGTYYSGTDKKTCTLEITAPTGSATAPTPVDVFSETFNGCDGTGGNSGGWGGNIASKAYSNTMADNTWSMTTAYAADKCVRMGTGSSLGIATTPAIALEGGITYTLTFRAGAWSGKSTNLKVSMTNGTLSADHVTMKDGAFDDFELTITEASAGATITFEGNTASNSQFLLDDVKVTMPAETSTSVTTIGGYATYCYQYPLNLDGISGAKAYIVSSVNKTEEKLMLTQITGTIKGGVPFILKADGDDKTFEIPLADKSTNVPDGNLLIGTLAPTFVEQVVDGNTNFAYSKSNGCFVKLGGDGNTVPANRAYLPINLGGSSVKALTFDFGNATGINTVQGSGFKVQDSKIYNLAGQRVDGSRFKVNGSGLKTGIYIVNGKKVLVK